MKINITETDRKIAKVWHFLLAQTWYGIAIYFGFVLERFYDDTTNVYVFSLLYYFIIHTIFIVNQFFMFIIDGDECPFEYGFYIYRFLYYMKTKDWFNNEINENIHNRRFDHIDMKLESHKNLIDTAYQRNNESKQRTDKLFSLVEQLEVRVDSLENDYELVENDTITRSTGTVKIKCDACGWNSNPDYRVTCRNCGVDLSEPFKKELANEGNTSYSYGEEENKRYDWMPDGYTIYDYNTYKCKECGDRFYNTNIRDNSPNLEKTRSLYRCETHTAWNDPKVEE